MLAYITTQRGNGEIVVTVFVDGEKTAVSSASHLAFPDLMQAIADKDIPKVKDFLTNGKWLKGLGLDWDQNGDIVFDGERMFGTLVNRIKMFRNANLDFQPLWNFMKNLMANPDKRSREQLYDFLERYHCPITPDGNFIAYKSLKENYMSVSSGKESVTIIDQNGTVTKAMGRIPNKIGTTLEMDRKLVDSDPNSACSTGFHAGSSEYVTNFSGNRKVIVEINPRDVVSVPKDSSWQKLRVCRYSVIADYDLNGKGEIKDQVFNPVATQKDVDAAIANSQKNSLKKQLETIISKYKGDNSRVADSWTEFAHKHNLALATNKIQGISRPVYVRNVKQFIKTL